jgi:hypothetical protein
VLKVCKFQIRPIHPPLGDFQKDTLNNNDPKGDKPNDSGSNNKGKDRKKKRRIRKIIYYDNDASSSSPKDDDDDDSTSKKKRLIKIILLIIPTFHITPMLIYYLFLMVSPLALMGKIFLEP